METNEYDNAGYGCFREMLSLVRQETLPVKERYRELYRIFNEVLKERTRPVRLDFSGPFARMDYLCKQAGYSQNDYRRINSFRAHCRGLHELGEQELTALFQDDLKTLSIFVSRCYGISVDKELSSLLLPVYTTTVKEQRAAADYVRIVVDTWDDTFIYGKTSDESSEFVRVAYNFRNYIGDWRYIKNLLTTHTQLNIIRPRIDRGTCYPELIVYEPDYLMDISAIASCFETYGCTPYNYLLNKIKPSANSSAILLGNFASQLLDEAVHSGNGQVSYNDSVRRFFINNTLNIAVCGDLQPSFHEQARAQKSNLERIIHEQFPEVCNLDMNKIVLEPSFLCEMLGLQGRMDLLQEDMSVLMEQKSGKREYLTDSHVEKHYVQMLLYLALLHYNYRKRNDEVSCFLLYSKYADGLMKEGPAPELLYKAFRLRNEVVSLEFAYGEGKAGQIFAALTPERVNVNKAGGTLWEKYIRPQMETLLQPIHEASPLELAYFNRLFTFLEKEHILSKLGSAAKEGSGFASVWNATEEEKRQIGDIYDGLSITRLDGDGTDDSGVSRITLTVPEQKDDFQPNFRKGDIVLLYSYPLSEEPDARKTMVFRCNMEEIAPDRIVVRMRAPQKNVSLFDKPDDCRWAIEHDFAESSFGVLYRSLYSFLNATARRRSLILGQRHPEADTSVALDGDYSDGGISPEFNELVLRAKQAKDYFLLIGPPGTGKTSFGLVNILKEELLQPDSSVLLLSYTNRAVDEICGKLVKHGVDFVRIGGAAACDEQYAPYLLSRRAAECLRIGDVRRLIAGTRVFVGTTTALSSGVALFGLKRFSLAIVDEASQILEPHLLALLSAKYGMEDAIRKFVFIGDHKQLPAVVMQSEQESVVTEACLKEIGLSDCRNSLFERLFRLQKGDDCFVYCMTKQGRMHPDVSAFPNRCFYGGTLASVPLRHQLSELNFKAATDDGLEQWMSVRRVMFFASYRPDDALSPKANLPEARIIARLIKTVRNLYRNNDRQFDPQQSLGVIVPYRNQIALIRKEIASYGIGELLDITIDTVERYQGSERDVMIYGFTVSRPNQLSFLSENILEEDGMVIDRKLNVALTRAREQMVLVGNPELLSLNPLYRHLLEYVRSNDGFYPDKKTELCL